MTLPVQTGRNDATGNGTADEFDFTFKILAASDLRVVTRTTLGVESVLTLNTDYTVDGVGVEGGGSITLTAGPLTSGHKITILRRRPLTQGTSIRNQNSFYAATHEDRFDAEVMVAQQQQEQISRSVKLPDSVPTSEFDPEIPMDMVGAENCVLMTNEDGTGWEKGPDLQAILEADSLVGDAEAAATAAAASAVAADASADAAAVSADEAEAAAALLTGLTANRALQSSATGTVEVSSVTSTELAHLSGVTSAIQTQLDAKQDTLGANDVDNTLLAQMPTLTIKGNNTGGTANADDLTAAEVTAMLDAFTDLLKGLVPASGGGTTNFLRADGTFAAPATGGTLAVSAKTANYTLTTSDDVVTGDSSGGTFTFTLPTAVGNTGKVFRLKKTDSSFTAIVIDGNGSETIDGATTKNLSTQNEQFTIVSDGANWLVIGHTYPQVWASYTPAFNGLGTVTSIEYFWRREADSIRLQGKAANGTVTAAEARAGFPTGLTSAGTSKIPSIRLCGEYVSGGTTGGEGAPSILCEPSVTYVTFGYFGSGLSGLTKLSGSALPGTSGTFSIDALVPISGWEG